MTTTTTTTTTISLSAPAEDSWIYEAVEQAEALDEALAAALEALERYHFPY